jgi:hypothetical protein
MVEPRILRAALFIFKLGPQQFQHEQMIQKEIISH